MERLIYLRPVNAGGCQPLLVCIDFLSQASSQPRVAPFYHMCSIAEDRKTFKPYLTACCLLRYRCSALWKRVYLQPINTNMWHAFQAHRI